MMNAYDKDYLYHSQKNFGHMVDFAVNTCDYDIDEFDESEVDFDDEFEEGAEF